MIQLRPLLSETGLCECGGKYIFSELIWQGLHVCKRLTCTRCENEVIHSLPVNQASLEVYSYYPKSGLLTDHNNDVVPENWFSSRLKTISLPVFDKIEVEVEVFERFDDVIILNTLDYIYGHSFLFLLNLQHIIERSNGLGIIVIVQPMLKWLLSNQNVSEIWTVKLEFQNFNNYYPDLSEKINNQLNRFERVFLSKGHVIPTNKNIQIEKFTGIRPFDFSNLPLKPKITFIWREDTGRLWIRNIYLLKGFRKIGMGKVLLPFHYLRVLLFFLLLRKRLGNKYTYSVAGLGNYASWPGFIKDNRVNSFNEESEKGLCKLYAQSILTIGVHGSSMLLPSSHSGMSVSLMPSKRWGNYGEDILFNENDIRLAFFQKRIVPINLCISDLRDIVCDMITGREYFVKKFIHTDDL